MRALVIGASGFIGLHVVDQLLARGIEVRVTCRKSTPTIFLRRRPVERAAGSLEEPAALREAMRDCDVVMLTGAYYPRYSLDLQASLEQGVTQVRNACNAALESQVPRFIYTSSIATLASVSGRAANEDDVALVAPIGSVYRAVKWAMEREVDKAAAAGLSVVTLLPGGCIGEGDLRMGTSGLLVLSVRGELPFWVDGMVNLVDVREVASAHVAAIDAPGTRYCLSAQDFRFGALLQQLVARYGGRLPPRLDLHEAQRWAEAEERSAAPRKARVAFPRELVDVIASGQAVDCTRARAELGTPLSSVIPAFDRAHAFFRRFGVIPASTSAERYSA